MTTTTVELIEVKSEKESRVKWTKKEFDELITGFYVDSVGDLIFFNDDEQLFIVIQSKEKYDDGDSVFTMGYEEAEYSISWPIYELKDVKIYYTK